MTVASTRAQAIAHILWELKKAEKLATLSSIAARVGFSPGSNGRTVNTSLKTVRRDWPQLQWWRAVADDGIVEEEQKSFLAEGGFDSEPDPAGGYLIKEFAAQLMVWEDPNEDEAVDDGDGVHQ